MSAIKLWIIEKKTKFGMWKKCAECPVPQPKGSVRGLTEARYVAPEIDTSALLVTVVCPGNRINYTVPIKGAPKPRITWKINEKTVYSDDHYDVTVQRRLTTIDVAFSKRYDAGTYSLEISNEHGTASARANVTAGHTCASRCSSQIVWCNLR